jgi:pyridoxamine 5'-phosphate oxidase
MPDHTHAPEIREPEIREPDIRADETAPFDLFAAWFAEAEQSEPNDPNGMTLATATAGGVPSARMVLLKGQDGADHPARGFVFYTNTESRKGGELLANPRAALLFHWKSLRRQIRIEGAVTPVAPAEADAYYASRHRLSRLGAWASDQSRPVADRAVLERRVAEAEARFPDEAIPRPPHWSGFRVTPARFEFWQDMPYRLHDRTIYARAPGGAAGDGWTVGKLFP